MKITLSDTPLLTPQQIGELASTLDLLHKRTLSAIERLNKDVATRKQQIASRWKSAAGIGAGDVARFAQNETLASVREIQDNSKAELDRIIKEAAPGSRRAAHAATARMPLPETISPPNLKLLSSESLLKTLRFI